MRKKIIKIIAKNGLLEVTLNDLLDLIPSAEDVTWSILNVEAIGNNNFKGSVLDLEKEVEDSDNGLILSTIKLKDLSKRFSQIIDLTLIGDRNLYNLKRYQSIDETYEKCDYVLELVDSSYWIVNAKSSFVELIAGKLL